MCKLGLVISFFLLGSLVQKAESCFDLFSNPCFASGIYSFFGPFFWPFLDHFWDPHTGHTPLFRTQITACIGFSGPRFWMRFWTFLVTIFGCQIPIRNWQFWWLKIDEWKMSQKNIKQDNRMGAKKTAKNRRKMVPKKWNNKSLLTHT